jgi:hypothetical protein
MRLALAAALAAVAAAAVVSASSLRAQPTPLELPETSAVLVVDISSSITSDVYRQIEHTLHTAVASGKRYGLVLFSDVAYEALPPGAPAAELEAYRRFFTPVVPEMRAGSPSPTASDLTFPPNPWSAAFSGGTRISTGLALTLRVLDRERIRRPSVVLVSDLADDATDLPRLATVLGEYERRQIPIRVVALSPGRDDLAVFESLLRGNGQIREAPKPPNSVAAPLIEVGENALPRGLAALVALLLVLLGLNELSLGRLTWKARA